MCQHQESHERGREHEVELLFDRERPEVQHGRGCRELIGIGATGQDEPPVGDVGQRGQAVGAKPARARRPRDERRDRRRERDSGERGGQQPARPATEEGAQPDPPVAVVLGQQQPGDEEPGQREEGRDAEEPAGQTPVVVREHRDDRERPQPVQCRFVARARHPAQCRIECGRVPATLRTVPART